MGTNVALEGPTLDWARQRFANYYGAAVIDPPLQLERREFAAFPFATETLMRRHAAFGEPGAFKRYLREEVPRHVYYSSAYYEHPDHPTMASKGWQGADLIFDLDADHLRDAAGKGYVAQLELVKSKVRDLLDDFLFRDLGVDPSKTQLVFSGGRGYHVHVRDESFLDLNSPERREIVDYILGTGVDPARVVSSRMEETGPGAVSLSDEPDPEGGEPSRSRRSSKTYRKLASPEAPGWPGRITRSFHRTLAQWEVEGEERAVQDLVAWGVPKLRATRVAKGLVRGGKGRAIREKGTLDVYPQEAPEEILGVVLAQATVEVQGETDAPVTTDIHRLIRLPGSLHGGTGFRVTPLERSQLDGFDPFRDARPYVGNGSSEVLLAGEVDYPFSPAVRGRKDETIRVPDDVALFLVLRGEATLRPGPGP